MPNVLSSPVAVAVENVGALGHALDSGGVVLVVLLLLILMSVISWFIIGWKLVTIRQAIKENAAFARAFQETTHLAELYAESEVGPESPARAMFRAGYEELDLIIRERSGRSERPVGDGPSALPATDVIAFENVERSLRQVGAASRIRLERGLGFLATVGSAGPFIGLFGTVWGIMNAFANIDPSRPILETVTPHIAEALVATAIGLLAAIPAVMAFNGLNAYLTKLDVALDGFITDYLNIVRRHFFS